MLISAGRLEAVRSERDRTVRKRAERADAAVGVVREGGEGGGLGWVC